MAKLEEDVTHFDESWSANAPADNGNSGHENNDDVEVDYDEPWPMDDVESDELRCLRRSIPLQRL